MNPQNYGARRADLIQRLAPERVPLGAPRRWYRGRCGLPRSSRREHRASSENKHTWPVRQLKEYLFIATRERAALDAALDALGAEEYGDSVNGQLHP